MKLPIIAGLAATFTLTSALAIPLLAPKPSLTEPMATSVPSMPAQATDHAYKFAPGVMIPDPGLEPLSPDADHAHDATPGVMVPNQGLKPVHPDAEQNIAARDYGDLPTHNVFHMPTDEEKKIMVSGNKGLPSKNSIAPNDPALWREEQPEKEVERRAPRCNIHGDSPEGTPMCI